MVEVVWCIHKVYCHWLINAVILTNQNALARHTRAITLTGATRSSKSSTGDDGGERGGEAREGQGGGRVRVSEAEEDRGRSALQR